MRALLVSNLESAGLEVVPEQALAQALEGRAYGSLTTDDYTEISQFLRASSWIRGRVSHERRRWSLSVSVIDGATGERAGGSSWSGRTMRDMRSVGRNGAARLSRFLAGHAPERSSEAGPPVQMHPPSEPPRARRDPNTPDPNTPDPSPRETAARRREAEPPAADRLATEPRAVSQHGASDSRSRSADDELPPALAIADDSRPNPHVSPPDSHYDGLRLSVSAGTSWRSFRTDALVYAVRRGQDPSDPANTLIGESRGYTSSAIGHGELGLEGEIYPGALSFGGEQPFPYLGILFSFRHSVGLLSFGCERGAEICQGASQVDVPTAQLDLTAGLRGRYRFGDRRGDFELSTELLYGLSAFVFDTERLQLVDYEAIVPPMEYHHVDLGVGVSFAPIQDLLTISIRADYRLGVQLGPKAREVWGMDTQPSNGALVGLELRHEAVYLTKGLFVALRTEYFFFETLFRGQVGCARPSSCPDVPPDQAYLDDAVWEPWPVDASGRVVGGVRQSVFDHYFRWGIYLGAVFR